MCIRDRINGQDINFASEADFLKAERLWQEMSAAQASVPSFGSGGGGGNGRGTGAWLRTGADAAAAVGAFLNGRAIRNKLNDLQDSLDDRRAAMAELDVLANNTKFVELIPVLKKLFLAERDSTETSVALLEDCLLYTSGQTQESSSCCMGTAGTWSSVGWFRSTPIWIKISRPMHEENILAPGFRCSRFAKDRRTLPETS